MQEEGVRIMRFGLTMCSALVTMLALPFCCFAQDGGISGAHVETYESSLVLGYGGMHNEQNVHIGFIPGDGFFVFRMTEGMLALESVDEHLRVQYWILKRPGAFSYKIGVPKMRIDGGAPLLASLRSVYKNLRPLGPTTVIRKHTDTGEVLMEEIDAPLVFVYGKQFDINKGSLGLRYNDAWRLQEYFGTRDYTKIPYPNLIGVDSVVEDWRGAGLFQALPFTRDKSIDWFKASEKLQASEIVVKADDIKMLVLHRNDLRSVWKREEGVEMSEVSLSGVQLFELGSTGKWRVSVPEDSVEDE